MHLSVSPSRGAQGWLSSAHECKIVQRARTSPGMVEAHFDGPTVCGSDRAASQTCFPRLEVLSIVVCRASLAQLSLGSRSNEFLA